MSLFHLPEKQLLIIFLIKRILDHFFQYNEKSGRQSSKRDRVGISQTFQQEKFYCENLQKVQ